MPLSSPSSTISLTCVGVRNRQEFVPIVLFPCPHWSDHWSTFKFGQGTFGISFYHSHFYLGMMDRPSTSTNPLLIEHNDDMNSYSPRATSLVHNVLCIKSNKPLVNASTTSPPTCDSLSNVQGTTSTTSSTITSKKMTQEWTRFVICCSTALLPL